MFLINKIKLLSLLCIWVLTACTSQNKIDNSIERALEGELQKNQARFLHQPISDVLIAFARQPTKTIIEDKQNSTVWHYDIYDHLIDPQTKKQLSTHPVFPFVSNKIHWKEFYYVNNDGEVYDIKIEAGRN